MTSCAPTYRGGMTELSDAVVLVVGASGGLGRRLADRLEQAGARVARAGRDPERTGGPYRVDLRDAASISETVDAVIRDHGRLDGVVVAAGVVAFGRADQLDDATLAELVEVNATGPIRLIRDAAPHLLASAADGRTPFVLTLSGVVSEAPTAGLAAYSASKAALYAFTQAAGRDLRREGLRLVDARPGHVETGLAEHPIAGTAPAFPKGLDADAVADRLVQAIRDDERDLPGSAFGG